MKKQQSQPQYKFDEKSLQQLILRKRLADKQLENIKSMSLHQLIDKTRKKQPILPPSPTMNYVRQNYQNSLRAAGFQNNIEEIADKHMQMVEEAERKNIIIRRQMRQMPIFSQIKRGKLGLDSVFILFAIIGSVSLPFIFYQRFKKNKQIIIKSRKYSPEVIQNISDDSPIDIDSVSQQSIHYDNPARRRAFEEKMKMAEKITALKKDLDL